MRKNLLPMFLNNRIFLMQLLFLSSQTIVFSQSTLKNAASYKIGVAVNIKSLYENTRYKHLVTSQFNSITAENALKMHKLMLDSATYFWKDADSWIAFAQQHKMRMHGHTLLWHSAIPKWINPAMDSAQLEQIIKNHVLTLVGRYKGKVKSWDVVNELFDDEDSTVRSHFVYKKLGLSIVERMFKYAHEADPNALLFYNDFSTEISPKKNRALIRLLDSLKAHRIPIHGVGFQMHINLHRHDSVTMARHIHEVAKRGYLIHFSELDIENNRAEPLVYTDSFAVALAEKYALVARIYNTIPKAQQYGITFWNVYDGDTWIRGYFKRKNEWPLLFDEQMMPKKAFNSFINELRKN